MLTDDDVAAESTRAVNEQAGRQPRTGVDAAGIFRRGRRQRYRRIATGVASAAAVAGLVTGLVVTGADPSAPSNPHGQLPGNTLLDAQVAPALTAEAADAGMPGYYIVASAPTLAPLEVRNSETGKVVSTVSPPATCDPKSLRLAAAGNNRDFVFSCSTSPGSNSFYRLQISASGDASALTRLSIPDPGGLIYDMALSPDGSRLAIPGTGTIEVVTLATGAVRTWTVRSAATLFNVTWSGDGRGGGTWGPSGLYVVNVSGAGSSPHPARLVLPRAV